MELPEKIFVAFWIGIVAWIGYAICVAWMDGTTHWISYIVPITVLIGFGARLIKILAGPACKFACGNPVVTVIVVAIAALSLSLGYYVSSGTMAAHSVAVRHHADAVASYVVKTVTPSDKRESLPTNCGSSVKN